MTPRGRARDLLAAAAFAGAALWFTALWSLQPVHVPAYDLYEYYFPNMLYAASRVQHGGTGLLWNAYQHCGQPFFGISLTGVLYPFNLFYLLCDPDLALRIVTALNFAVAGAGMYALCRELGVGRAAAVVGAMTFEFGSATVHLNTWGPQMGGAWVWMPIAVLCCERLLRAPRGRDVVGLGGALAVLLLPGFPQTVFFAYQLIALRVLFEIAAVRSLRVWRSAGAVGLGLLLAPLLTAVTLLPAGELAALSVRGGQLTIDEIRAGGFLTWSGIRTAIALRDDLAPLLLIPCIVAGACWIERRTRRPAMFYALAGALYLALSLGTNTPLFALYFRMPFGALFRIPLRFLWMTGFCLAILTAFGAEAIAAMPERPRWWRRWTPAAATAAALAGVYFLSPNRLYPFEWILAAAVVTAAVLAAGGGRIRRHIALALVVIAPLVSLLAFNGAALPDALQGRRGMPFQGLLPDRQVYFEHAGAFEFLRRRMTAQDRIYIVHKHAEFSLMAKSAALFGVPSVQDYEPEPTRRSAEYIVFMRSGHPMSNLNEYYMDLSPSLLRWFRKPLLDLAAVRYVIADPSVDNTADVLGPSLVPLSQPDDSVAVYENQQALPRAAWVPRARVLTDPHDLLDQLAAGAGAQGSVLLEAPPPSGFVGPDPAPPGADGSAAFLIDQPEDVLLRVDAPARGFLRLTDQNFPGWSATVNGAPAPILPANFLFRAVEVPPGTSLVEFRYRPASVFVGAAISAATLIVLAAAAVLHHGRTPDY